MRRKNSFFFNTWKIRNYINENDNWNWEKPQYKLAEGKQSLSSTCLQICLMEKKTEKKLL